MEDSVPRGAGHGLAVACLAYPVHRVVSGDDRHAGLLARHRWSVVRGHRRAYIVSTSSS